MDHGTSYIFNLSMHKVATRSIHRFIVSLGYTGIHYPRWLDGEDLQAKLRADADGDEILRTIVTSWPACVLFSDVPIPGLYREAAAAFPDSYFVLATRDPELWWNTLRRHWQLEKQPRRLDFYEYIQYAPYGYPRDRPVTKNDGNLFKEMFVEHERQVTNMFAGSDAFLKVDIDKDPIEEKIGTFFGASDWGSLPYHRTGNREVKSRFAKAMYKVRNNLGI